MHIVLVHNCMYMYMYWGWDEGWKTTFEASSAKMNECLKVHVFINVALTLVGYRKPPTYTAILLHCSNRVA